MNLNTELLLKVADYLEHNEDHELDFNMDSWWELDWENYKGQDCKTTACIAGTAVYLDFTENPAVIESADARYMATFEKYSVRLSGRDTVAGKAKDLLGLTNNQAAALFNMGVGSAGPLDMPIWKVTPAMAAEVIRNFVATGYVDWAKAVQTVDRDAYNEYAEGHDDSWW